MKKRKKKVQRGKTRRSLPVVVSPGGVRIKEEQADGRTDTKQGKRKIARAKVVEEEGGKEQERRVSVEIYRSASYGNLAVAV